MSENDKVVRKPLIEEVIIDAKDEIEGNFLGLVAEFVGAVLMEYQAGNKLAMQIACKAIELGSRAIPKIAIVCN